MFRIWSFGRVTSISFFSVITSLSMLYKHRPRELINPGPFTTDDSIRVLNTAIGWQKFHSFLQRYPRRDSNSNCCWYLPRLCPCGCCAVIWHSTAYENFLLQHSTAATLEILNIVRRQNRFAEERLYAVTLNHRNTRTTVTFWR